MGVWSLGEEDPLEEETATHSSILACKIPWKEEFGGLQFMRSQELKWLSAHTHKPSQALICIQSTWISCGNSVFNSVALVIKLHSVYLQCSMKLPLVTQIVKDLPAMRETQVRPLGREDPLEKGMATHSSILAWRIPRTEEPGRLQSMGLQRVRHDWANNTFSFPWNLRWCLNQMNQSIKQIAVCIETLLYSFSQDIAYVHL